MRKVLLAIGLSFLFLRPNDSFSFEPPKDLYTWFANNVDYVQGTHASSYVVFSSDRMGPNALPVPIMNNGLVDTINFVGLGLNNHSYSPDPARSVVLYYTSNIVKNVLTIQSRWVLWEYYNKNITEESHLLKEERNISFLQYYNKRASGDLTTDIMVQISREEEMFVDALGRIGIRYPTSSGVGAARFTDNTGYYMSLSFGKKLIQNKSKYLKMIAEIGFLSYQTNNPSQRQNDAPMYGLGIEANYKKLMLTNSIEGYAGYFLNGDRPLIYRSTLNLTTKHLLGMLRFEKGLHDYRYTNLELMLGFRLDFLPSYEVIRHKK